MNNQLELNFNNRLQFYLSNRKQSTLILILLSKNYYQRLTYIIRKIMNKYLALNIELNQKLNLFKKKVLKCILITKKIMNLQIARNQNRGHQRTGVYSQYVMYPHVQNLGAYQYQLYIYQTCISSIYLSNRVLSSIYEFTNISKPKLRTSLKQKLARKQKRQKKVLNNNEFELTNLTIKSILILWIWIPLWIQLSTTSLQLPTNLWKQTRLQISKQHLKQHIVNDKYNLFFILKIIKLNFIVNFDRFMTNIVYIC